MGGGGEKGDAVMYETGRSGPRYPTRATD